MNTNHQNLNDLFGDIVLHKISIKENWLEIKYRFDCIYPSFFMEFYNSGIQLTTSEERFLLLEKIGINPKNIAQILEVLPESIYTLKYRLQKKIKSQNLKTS